MRQSLRRRRHLLLALVAIAFVTLVAAVLASQPRVWGVQLLADVLLVAYLAMLIHARNISADVEMSSRVLRN